MYCSFFRCTRRSKAGAHSDQFILHINNRVGYQLALDSRVPLAEPKLQGEGRSGASLTGHHVLEQVDGVPRRNRSGHKVVDDERLDALAGVHMLVITAVRRSAAAVQAVRDVGEAAQHTVKGRRRAALP